MSGKKRKPHPNQPTPPPGILQMDNIISAQLIPENRIRNNVAFGKFNMLWAWYWLQKAKPKRTQAHRWWNHLIWPVWGESHQWLVRGCIDTIVYIRIFSPLPEGVLALATMGNWFYTITNLHGFGDNPDPFDTMPYVEYSIPLWDTVDVNDYKLTLRGERVLLDKHVLTQAGAYPSYHVSPDGRWLALVIPDKGTAITEIKS